MHKLPQSKVPEFREQLLTQQAHRCMLCTEVITDDAVLDHDHKTGHIRAVLHRGCNALLGHIENNRARNGLAGPRLFRMLARIEAYLTRDYSQNPLHHTHRTDEQKRIRRNKLAAASRARRKAAATAAES